MSKHVLLKVPRDRCDYDHGDDDTYRSCLVDPDGTVHAWDAVAETFSRHHELSEEEQSRARALAGTTPAPSIELWTDYIDGSPMIVATISTGLHEPFADRVRSIIHDANNTLVTESRRWVARIKLRNIAHQLRSEGWHVHVHPQDEEPC